MRKRLSEKYGSKEANSQFASILLLRRRCSQEELLRGVEQALDCGAIEYAAIELMVRQAQISQIDFDAQEIYRFIPMTIPQWEFDLTPYAELCEEIAS